MEVPDGTGDNVQRGLNNVNILANVELMSQSRLRQSPPYPNLLSQEERFRFPTAQPSSISQRPELNETVVGSQAPQLSQNAPGSEQSSIPLSFSQNNPSELSEEEIETPSRDRKNKPSHPDDEGTSVQQDSASQNLELSGEDMHQQTGTSNGAYESHSPDQITQISLPQNHSSLDHGRPKQKNSSWDRLYHPGDDKTCNGQLSCSTKQPLHSPINIIPAASVPQLPSTPARRYYHNIPPSGTFGETSPEHLSALMNPPYGLVSPVKHGGKLGARHVMVEKGKVFHDSESKFGFPTESQLDTEQIGVANTAAEQTPTENHASNQTLGSEKQAGKMEQSQRKNKKWQSLSLNYDLLLPQTPRQKAFDHSSLYSSENKENETRNLPPQDGPSAFSPQSDPGIKSILAKTPKIAEDGKYHTKSIKVLRIVTPLTPKKDSGSKTSMELPDYFKTPEDPGQYRHHLQAQSEKTSRFLMTGGRGDEETTSKRRRNSLYARFGSPPKFALGHTMTTIPEDVQIVPNNMLSVQQSQEPTPLIEVDKSVEPSTKFREFLRSFQHGNPTFDNAMMQIPLCNQLEIHSSSKKYGVLRIMNVPYSITRTEIMAFLGRNAALIEDSEGEPIHIIMDRLTGKTNDVYVEFVSLNEATAAASRWINNRHHGRAGRLGDRHVQIDVVGPEVLMQELFPKTRHVFWQGYEPFITQANSDNRLDTPFQCFVTEEELTMLLRHIEQPHRSAFNKDSPQRPYECLISIMIKYPWHMTEYIRVKDRDFLWRVVLDATVTLVQRIAADVKQDEIHLTPRLLKRLCSTVRKCKGFTVAQKYEIHQIAEVRVADWVPYPAEWIWQALGPQQTLLDEDDMMLYFMALINKLSSNRLSYQARRKLSEERKKPLMDRKDNLSMWGPIRIQYPKDYQNLSMKEIADLEWKAIEDCLRDLDHLQNTLSLTN